MNAREVIAQALRDADGVRTHTTYDDERADAVLAALREHWTSDEVRVWAAVRTPDNRITRAEVRAVTAALLDGGDKP